MPTVTFLPHEEICPEQKTIEVSEGTTILEAALENSIELEHACDGSCSCTTCHIVVIEGFDSLEEAGEDELDMLDKAWGLEIESRLGCQAKVTDENLVIKIPKYHLNQVDESH